jgi:hypothetical protein
VECNDRLFGRNPIARDSANPLPEMPNADDAFTHLAGPTGFELRTFDCSKCDYVEKVVIASDPMKSGDVGWLVGDLRPPT